MLRKWRYGSRGKYKYANQREIDGSFAVSGGLVAAAISQPSPPNATAASTMHAQTRTIPENINWITNIHGGNIKNDNM